MTRGLEGRRSIQLSYGRTLWTWFPRSDRTGAGGPGHDSADAPEASMQT